MEQEIIPPEEKQYQNSHTYEKGFFERFGAWLDKITGGLLGGLATAFGMLIAFGIPMAFIAMLIHFAETAQWAWFVITIFFPPAGLLGLILWLFGIV